MAEKEEQLEEFKINFKNGALKNLERLSIRFKADGDLEKVVARAIKLLTFVQDAKDGRVMWDDEKGHGYFVNIDEL